MAKQNNQTNVFSILSLIFGILFFVPIAPILAIVFGFIALSQIKQTKEQGKGMAAAGIILGVFWIMIYILLIIFFIIFLSSVLLMATPLMQ